MTFPDSLVIEAHDSETQATLLRAKDGKQHYELRVCDGKIILTSLKSADLFPFDIDHYPDVITRSLPAVKSPQTVDPELRLDARRQKSYAVDTDLEHCNLFTLSDAQFEAVLTQINDTTCVTLTAENALRLRLRLRNQNAPLSQVTKPNTALFQGQDGQFWLVDVSASVVLFHVNGGLPDTVACAIHARQPSSIET